jgi:hypothetical protein
MACDMQAKAHSIEHSVVTSSGETITIENTFYPCVVGVSNMLNQNAPLFVDGLSGLQGTFQDNATNGVMDRGCYAISVEKGAQDRALASGADMSGAGSLKSVGLPMGQGVALQGEKWPTNTGRLIFDARQSAFQNVGMQIYGGPQASYPQVLWVKLDLKSGQSVLVDVATLFSESDWPEEGAGTGYGYLTTSCSVPFDRLFVGFDSQYLLKNNLYAGGLIALSTQNVLVNLPGFPTDQTQAILGNMYVYSAVAGQGEQSLAANQLLGLDCIQQNSQISLGLDPRSLFSLFQGPDPQPTAGDKSNTVTIHTMGIGQSGREVKSGLKGFWLTYSREVFKNWSAGVLGGYSQDRAESVYNTQYTQYRWAGLQVKRQRADGLGCSWVQNIVFGRNHFLNTRVVPLFDIQAEQNYSGYTGSSLTQLQWVFPLNSGWLMAPYGRVAYAWQRRKAFQETMFIYGDANETTVVLAQNSALQFNKNFASCMVQEYGLLMKKSWADEKFYGWFSGGLGHIQSLGQSMVQVCFVDFSQFFQISPEKTNAAYLSPAVGLAWHFRHTWCLNMGASMQKTVGHSPSNDWITWSVWCSVNKVF